MCRISWNFKALLVLALALIKWVATGQGESSPRILLICSYDPSFPTFESQLAGLRSALEAGRYSLDIEFMDSKRIPGTDTMERFEEALRYKLERLPGYDLVVTAHDNALRLIEVAGDELFPDTPVVFFGVNDEDFGLDMGRRGNVTGILEYESFQETLDLMRAVFPTASSYKVVFDGLPSSQAGWKTLVDDCELPNGVSIEPLDLTKLSFEELYFRLRSLSGEDLVLLIGAYEDSHGTVHTFEETLAGILRSSSVAIFHAYEFGIGQGLLGGKVVSYFDQGRLAGEMAVRILSGEQAEGIPVVERSPNRYLVDSNLLANFRLRKSDFPRETRFVNDEESFWERYRLLVSLISAGGLTLFAVAGSFFWLWLKQKRVSEELRQSEVHNNTLFNNPFAVMLVVDPSTGRIENANLAAIQFYGYTKEELSELTLFELSEGGKGALRSSLARALNSDFQLFSSQHRIKGGELRDVELSAGIVLLRSEKRLFCIVKDRTEAIAHQKALEKAKEDAVRANQVKDTFLSVMSHEMRTPLNPIIGFSDVMISECQREDEREQLEIIHQAGVRLQRIIDNVLMFSRLSAETYEEAGYPFSMQDVLDELRQAQAEFLNGNSVTVEVFREEGDEEYPFNQYLIGPIQFLREIVAQFLENALKYTVDGQVSLRASVRPKEAEKVLLMVEVKDTGVGIPKERLVSVFHPFEQVDGSYSRRFEGVGLGLAICQKMAEHIGATLTVESEVGVGTRFSVEVEMHLYEPAVATR